MKCSSFGSFHDLIVTLPPCWRVEGTPAAGAAAVVVSAAAGGTASVIVAVADGAEYDFFSRSRLA